MGKRLLVPSVTCLEGAFCETNVLFLFVLGPYDSGLIDDAFVFKAGAVEGAGAFRAVAGFIVVVDVGTAAYDFVVVALYDCFHVLGAAVADL